MYVPIMKNRTVEVNVLRRLSELGVFNHNVLPMIELVQKKTRTNMKSTFSDELLDILTNAPQMSVMLDFYKSAKLRSTSEAIRDYVTQTVHYPQFCYEELSAFGPLAAQIIPVVSYMIEDISVDRILADTRYFRSRFKRVAFRLKPQGFDAVFQSILPYIGREDYIIFDIGAASYTSPVFKQIYVNIAAQRKKIGYTSIVVKAHRPEDLTNKKMVDQEAVAEMDNGLKDIYSSAFMSKFDGFGDYATISAALPSTGGAISPVGIYYSEENNFFVAFKKDGSLLSEFPEYIAPSIFDSEYWDEFSEEHHRQCPGCQEILQIVNKEQEGKNQAQWKMIAMMHYIYTMYETNA